MADEKKLKILSAISLTESQVEKIKSVDPRVELHWYGRKDTARIPADIWRDAEILLTSGTQLPRGPVPGSKVGAVLLCRRGSRFPARSCPQGRRAADKRQRHDGQPDGRICFDGAADVGA